MSFQDYVDFIRLFFVKKAVKIALARIAASFPILMFGPMGFITTTIVTKLFDVVLNDLELVAFYKYTDIRTSSQGKNFESYLNIYLKNRTQENEKNAIDAFDKLVCLNS